ncbi:MAG TPA: hypothetical protein VIJ88_00800 [Candidatus Paceibacterota bacterium]
MLNPLPQLLTFSFFAPTLLRITVACVFFYIAYIHTQRRKEIGATRFILVGAMGVWASWVLVVLEAGVALGLFLGYYTQIAALLGLLLCIKSFVWAKKYPRVFFLCRIEYILLFVICLSLLLTGAGAFAFDLPL